MNKSRIRIFFDTSLCGQFMKTYPQKESIEQIKKYRRLQMNKIIYK